MSKKAMMSEEQLNLYHAEKMKKKKAVREKIDAQKTVEKGLLVVNTGKGKGKSTAAFGTIFRALGHGMKVGVVQFGKGSRLTGERIALEKFSDLVRVFAAGEGFTWETQDRAKDVKMAEEAWDIAKEMILDDQTEVVLCDELNIVLRYDYLSLDEVLAVLRARPAGKHVIVTGRNARDEMIEAADLVTDMELVKHPFRAGVKAQKGIEF